MFVLMPAQVLVLEAQVLVLVFVLESQVGSVTIRRNPIRRNANPNPKP